MADVKANPPAKPGTAKVKHARDPCNNLEAVQFVQDHLEDAKKLASEAEVPVENMLGLAAQESQYGAGRIAREYKNYFSMHAPAMFQTREEPALNDPKVQVAVFDSFYQSGRSFLARFGDAIHGKSDPDAFAQALVKAGFNSGKAATGGRDNFAHYLADIIRMVQRRMACSTKE
jgi:flagellum-specific peptidoglycan hydrolase FlgJ